MKLIGLTGGIASGKSTVSDVLRELGVPIIDADRVAREVEAQGGTVWRRLVREFGPDIVGRDGQIDRRELGRRAFSTPERTMALNRITHPSITRLITARIQELRDRDVPVAVLDAPLLLEAGIEGICDEVWVVYVDPGTQYDRLLAREGYDQDEARTRIRAQLPMGDKVARADVVIDNRGDVEATRAQVIAEFRRVSGEGPDV